MSEYLGWRERKPPPEYDTSRFDRNIIPGGPMTQNYEAYVRNIFRPNNKPSTETIHAPSGFTSSLDGSGSSSSHAPITLTNDTSAFGSADFGGLDMKMPQKISATTMLKLEQHLGKDALDDSNDMALLDKSPLERMYDELGLSGIEQKTYQQYQVYAPKSSSEYFSVMHSSPNPQTAPTNYRGSFRSYKDKVEDAGWRKDDRQFLVDYKDFTSSPLSPYMYHEHPYVRRQDSRIVGSNFVQVTTRPRDRFLDKIDKTLAEVRAMPRY
uniref:Uncharacterized protein n=1 Tax=Panagrolaimus superbus TaxID=310955 RepID=A0A914ZCB1_9BILA